MEHPTIIQFLRDVVAAADVAKTNVIELAVAFDFADASAIMAASGTVANPSTLFRELRDMQARLQNLVFVIEKVMEVVSRRRLELMRQQDGEH